MSLDAGLTSERVLTGGNSLTLTDGGANGLATLDLDTPGTCTVSTGNSAPGPHTHAITSSSNPGAAAGILASDASGYLQLVRLGIGIAPTTPLQIYHATVNNIALFESGDSVGGIRLKDNSSNNGVDLNAVGDDFRLVNNGAITIYVTAGGSTGFGTTSPDRLTHAEVSDAVTAAVTYAMRLSHITSGTAAAGFGTGLEFELEDSGGGMDIAASIEAVWLVPTAGGEKGALQLSVVSGGIVIEEFLNAPNIVGGYSGNSVTLGKKGSTISGGGFSGGSENSISEDFGTICGGWNNTVSADSATVVGGYAAVADKYGQVVNSSNQFASAGDCQGTIQMVLSRSVTHSDATWYELWADGSTEKVIIATDTVWTFHVLLVGTTQGCAKSFGFEIVGVIENDGGTTSILASTVTTIYDTDDTDFDARANANDIDDALRIQVQDSTSGGDTVRWVASLRMAEVTYPA
jgi:hypothetical protein